MKKILCFFLSMFLLLNIVNIDTLRINSSAEVNTSEYATVKVITNNIPEKIVEGAQIGADIKTKKEKKTTLIKKNNKIYMPLDDICEFTRTNKEKAGNKYILKQGRQEITVFIEDNGNAKLKSFYGDFNIQTVTENNKMYCEPEPLMSMLFADCTYYDNTLLIDLPQYTVYEATNFDYSKYQSDVLSYGIDENTDNMGTALIKFGLVVQRTAISFSSDIFVDSNYGFFATDNAIRQNYYEAFNEVLGYDIYSNESVIEEETKIYEKINDLGSFLEKTQGGDISDTPFTDFYISSYIDSYAKKGLKDNNSLSVFNDTIRDLSTNGRVNEKLNSYLNQSGKDVLTNILFNSALEYVKRSSYDRKVLQMFKTLYSEETVNKYNISLSENGQFFFQCARDYYNSCGSFNDIVKEVTLNESINKFSEMIIKGLFSVTTAGKSQEVFETYETILTAEKLQESNNSFKPVEKINNSAKYFWLSKMQYTTVLTLDKISKKAEESLNSEDMANLVANFDFYNRVSAVMIKTLADSYQLPTTTKREKDLIANSQQYINELCQNVYKLEYCEYNLPTKEELNNKNCDVFNNFFSKQPIEPIANYEWHLAPTIEAEDIINSDEDSHLFGTQKDYHYPSDKYSVIKQNGKYGIINYDGIYYAEAIYDVGGFGTFDEDLYVGYSYPEGHSNDDFKDIVMFPDEKQIRISNFKGGRGIMEHKYLYNKANNKIYYLVFSSHSPTLLNDDNSYFYSDHEVFVVEQYDFDITKNNSKYPWELTEKSAPKFGVSNKTDILVPCEYDNGCMNNNGEIVALEKDDKWGFFNKNGEQIIDFICDSMENKRLFDDWCPYGFIYNQSKYPYLATENYIPIKINGKCGYYDTQGNEVIPCGTFEEVRPVHNGLAWVKQDGKWGVIKLKNIETEPNTPQAFTQEQLNSIRKLLSVPEDLDVTIKQETPFYWKTGEIWITHVSIYCEESIIASVDADSITAEFIKEIMMYSIPIETKEPLLTGIVNTEKDPLNVRKSPSMDAKIIGRIDKGSTVTVYSENGDWYEIEYNGGIGYVSKKYIKVNGSTSNEQTSNISDNEILKAVNKYLEENQGHLGTWFTVSDAPYCPVEHIYSNDKKWSCPINLSWESYSANEIAGAYPHFAYVDKSTLECTLTANYETVVEFDLNDYIQ